MSSLFKTLVSWTGIKQPETYISTAKNPTINLLERIIKNQKQIDGESYVRRQPKYLFNVPDRFEMAKQAALEKAELQKQKTRALMRRCTRRLTLHEL